MTEQELAALCKSGDRRALKMLYEKYATWMMGISMRYMGNEEDSKDILHDSFVKVFGSIQRFEYRGQMMNLTGDLLHAGDEDWKMLSFPYGNQGFSMIIFMPYEDVNLDDKITTLTTEKFYSLFESLSSREIMVKLPKFKAEYKYNLHVGILPAMGIKKIFDPIQADLSEMSRIQMFVDVVSHKTFIEVDEQGTEAAAVTVGTILVTSVPPPPVDFFVNRPFVYSIVENSTGTILFMGKINRMELADSI